MHDRHDRGFRYRWLLISAPLALGFGCTPPASAEAPGATAPGAPVATIDKGDPPMLEKPLTRSGGSLNQALADRRSIRSFGRRPLNRSEISQLLWAAQGITSPDGFRTAPSAGGTLPLELHLFTADGVFRYAPKEHRLEQLAKDDRRVRLADAALGQRCVRDAPAVFVIAGIISRTSWKYGERAERYVAIEAGAAGQNLLLQATALGLGAVYVGAFDDSEVVEVAELPDKAVPFGVIPVGTKP